MVKKNKSKKSKKQSELPVVMLVTVNNKGFVNEYTANARFSIGWTLGANGIKSIAYTYDSHPISLARCQAVEDFLKSPCSHLFFLDSDSVPKADIVLRLLQYDKPVVSGWYLSRIGSGLPVVLRIIAKDTPKCTPCLIKHPEKFPEWRAYTLEELLTAQKEKNTGLVKVDGVGAGALLIKREVFSHLEKPYFYEDHLNINSFGEDLWFGLNCKVHKVPIYVDINCLVEHWSWGLIGERHVKALLQRNMKQQIQNKMGKK